MTVVPGGKDSETPTSLELGRYTLHGKIAGGGMATVHLGRQRGAAGFSRVVAIKRMLPRFAKDPRFVAMFVNEAMLASRIQHPNVVTTLDVVADSGEILIVMEYIRGDSLSSLAHAADSLDESISVEIAAGIMIGALAGLHAAHEARDGKGEPVRLVHRDVSPHNILVGIDGVARVMDFGIAKATQRLGETQDGVLKGKLSYTAPECFLRGSGVADARSDVFSAGVVFWGLLAGRKLFHGVDVGDAMAQVLAREPEPLVEVRDDVPAALDEVIRRALARDPDERFQSAREFEDAVHEAVGKVASQRAIGGWVERLAHAAVANREAQVQAIEQTVVLDPARAVDISPLPFSGAPVATVTDPVIPSAPSDEVTRKHGGNIQDVTTILPFAPPSPSTDVTEPSVELPKRRVSPGTAIGAVLAIAIGIGILFAWSAAAPTPNVSPTPAAASVTVARPASEPTQATTAALDPTTDPPPVESAAEAPSSIKRTIPARPASKTSRGYFPPRP
jgi:serine/threonine protein kinase